jgi:hypothetical protein
MSELVNLHSRTGVGETGEYLPSSSDRQVGLGLLGLANFLAQNKVSYLQFGNALDRYFSAIPDPNQQADVLVACLAEGIQKAADVARGAGMCRAFAIAPTASCSYQYTDLRGYTTTPELAPPISRHVDRDSGTFGVQSFDYPPDVEIAAETGWEAYNKVVDGIVRLYQDTLLFHGYSYNSWSDVVTYDRDFLKQWLGSPQTSLYYALQVMPDTQAKDNALAALNESYHEFFKFDEINTLAFEDDEEVVGFCPTDNSCSSCAE